MNIPLVPSADIGPVEAFAYSTSVAVVDVADAYDVTDDDNLAVVARVDVAASHPANPDTPPFRHSLVCLIPPHFRDCDDAKEGAKKRRKLVTHHSSSSIKLTTWM